MWKSNNKDFSKYHLKNIRVFYDSKILDGILLGITKPNVNGESTVFVRKSNNGGDYAIVSNLISDLQVDNTEENIYKFDIFKNYLYDNLHYDIVDNCILKFLLNDYKSI